MRRIQLERELNMMSLERLVWTVRVNIQTAAEAMAKEWLTDAERKQLRQMLADEDLLDAE